MKVNNDYDVYHAESALPVPVCAEEVVVRVCWSVLASAENKCRKDAGLDRIESATILCPGEAKTCLA